MHIRYEPLFTALIAFDALIAISFPVYFLIDKIIERFKPRRNTRRVRFIITWFFYILVLFGLGTLPYLMRYSAHPKQITKEAKNNLQAIYQAQMKYQGEYHSFAGGPEAFDLLDWKPSKHGNIQYYTYYCGQDIVDPNNDHLDHGFIPGKNWPFIIHPSSSESSFTCLAICQWDEEKYPDFWMVDEKEEILNLADGIDNELIVDFYRQDPKDWGNVKQKMKIAFWKNQISVSENIFLATVLLMFLVSFRYERRRAR